MGETLDIRETGDELVIDIHGRNVAGIFLRQFQAPLIMFAILGAAALTFSWWADADMVKIVSSVGIYILIFLGIVAVALYRRAEPIGRPASLRVDDDGVNLRINDGDVEERYPFEDVQVLQVSEMSTASRNAKHPAFQLPGEERHELTLMTASEMHVVARGVDGDEAEEAVGLFHEHLPDSTTHD